MEENSVKHDDILNFAIYYCLHDGSYPDGLTKEKKRAVRKRAAKLETEKGEVFLLRKGKRIKVVQTEKEQKQILQPCHSDPTSGHSGGRATTPLPRTDMLVHNRNREIYSSCAQWG